LKMRDFARTLLAAALCLVVWMSAVWAQSASPAPSGPNYETWGSVTARAELAIENNRASEAAMGELRKQLVDWRSQFAADSTRRSVSEQTLQAQLNRLGPVPEGGEPDTVAQERQRLETLLSEAQAPARQAKLAQAEANELVRAIDALLRDRQTELLMEAGPVPIRPSLWAPAFAEVARTMTLLGLEFESNWKQQRLRHDLRNSLPLTLFYLALGLALLIRGRRWTDMMLNSIVSQSDHLSALRWVSLFFLSFGQVILPMLGAVALAEAVYATDLAGLRGGVVLSLLPQITFEILVAKWLGERFFSRSERPLISVNLNEKEKRRGRRFTALLGVTTALATLGAELARFENWDLGTESVVFFILCAMASVCLVQIALLGKKHAQGMSDDSSIARSALEQLLRFLAMFAIGAAVFGILVALAGLVRGGGFLIFSTSRTMFLIGFLLVAQRVIQKVFAALEGRNDDDSSLAAVITGIAMVILALPVLAITWGVRQADLQELWTQWNNGLSLGGLTLSPRMVLVLIVIFVAGHGITRLLQSFLRDNILPKTRMDAGGQIAIVSGAGYVGNFIAILVALSIAGINLSNIALFAGALSVGIGFGLQTIVSNFVSGIILLIERPVSEGDWIEVGGQMGYVRDISVRATRIETFDRTDVVVPNSDLISGTVTNFTRGNTVGRVIVNVGVAYGTDTRRVEAILTEIAQAHPMVLANPGPAIVFQGFGADALEFEIRAILRDVNWMLTVKSDLNHAIAERFVAEGIEIPFAQRDIWLRNPETLRGGADRDAVAPSASAAPEAQDAPKLGALTPPDVSDMIEDGDADGAPDGEGR
jgi:small-conductance mechanosensitive channel